jgi:CHAT domain-containing protein
VIATLWPVADAAAGRIATDFYTELGPSLDTDDTARALHRAVRALREDALDRPSLWAAHIHLESA